jgi:hypothetical protein
VAVEGAAGVTVGSLTVLLEEGPVSVSETEVAVALVVLDSGESPMI